MRSPAADAADEAGGWQEAVMGVTVNGQIHQDPLVVLHDGSGGVWVASADLEQLRVLRPRSAAHDHLGEQYFQLGAIAGATIDVDESTQTIGLNVPPEEMAVTQARAQFRTAPVLTEASPGGFLNYQLSAQQVGRDDLVGAYGELGVFSSKGVFTDTGVLRSLAGHSTAVRLDTAYTKDFPARIERLNVGDIVSDGTTWGSAVRFGGISWSRNFSLRPDLLTTPLLTATGTAVVPSTVDVYVNNAQVSSAVLPPGPFVIDRLPAVTGAGQVRVVVRDALGREQQLTQQFYSSLQLLAPGLSQYELDVGKLRRNYAIASFDYGAAMGSATYRRGITDSLTLETHAEYLDHQARTAGLAGAVAIAHLAVLNFTVAAGGGPGTSGSLYGIGVERQGSKFTVGFHHTEASEGYRQIATATDPVRRFLRRDLAQVGASFQWWGSLVAVLARQTFADRPCEQTSSLSYSRNLGERGTLNVTATRSTQGSAASNSVFVAFTFSLAERTALALTASRGQGAGAPADEVYASYMRNPPRGTGEGYRVAVSSVGNYNAQLNAQGPIGELQVQAARAQGVSGISAYLSGAATLLGGELHAARQVTDSFALVDVGGLPGIPVYLDNQLITSTDAHGRALVRDLLPYESNRVNIEPTEIPLDVSIAARTLEVTPGYRSGVIVKFPVERVQGATFRLVTTDGLPVPVGATVDFRGHQFPVTYGGSTYVTGYDRGAEGTAQWASARCAFQVDPPQMHDPQPDLGTLNCRAIDPSERTP